MFWLFVCKNFCIIFSKSNIQNVCSESFCFQFLSLMYFKHNIIIVLILSTESSTFIWHDLSSSLITPALNCILVITAFTNNNSFSFLTWANILPSYQFFYVRWLPYKGPTSKPDFNYTFTLQIQLAEFRKVHYKGGMSLCYQILSQQNDLTSKYLNALLDIIFEITSSRSY